MPDTIFILFKVCPKCDLMHIRGLGCIGRDVCRKCGSIKNHYRVKMPSGTGVELSEQEAKDQGLFDD